MDKGKIIFLNGPGSAGKSTLVRALQRKLPKPYFCMCLDTFTDIISPWFTEEYNGETPGNLERQSLSAMHHTIRLYSDLGYNVIVDHAMCKWVIDGKEWKLLEECVELLHDYPVFFVKVTCPLHELKRREIARGDRIIGSAEKNNILLYPRDGYDIIVDTYQNSTEECADMIIDTFNNTENFTAFKLIKEQIDKITL